MKKVLCLLFAALLLLAAGCGKSGRHSASPSPTPAVVTVPTDIPAAQAERRSEAPSAAPTLKPGTNTEYTNALVFENGRVVFGSFNWEFFCAKAGASMYSEIELVDKTEEGDVIRTLSFAEGVYIIEGEGMRKSFKYYRVGNAEIGGAEPFSGELGFLTNDPDLTAQELLSQLPEPVGIGVQGTDGMVIYLDRAE